MKYKQLSLSEQEDLVKQLVAEDINNPEIYLVLKNIVLVFLYRKKACDHQEEYEDISHTLATDIYMKMYTEGTQFTHYIGYINSVYKRYLQNYREELQGTTASYEELAETLLLNRVAKDNPFNKINNKVYLENISDTIDILMQKFCKYDAWSPAFNNLKLSLMLTILRDEEVCFHLNTEQSAYLGLLVSKFKEDIINAESL